MTPVVTFPETYGRHVHAALDGVIHEVDGLDKSAWGSWMSDDELRTMFDSAPVRLLCLASNQWHELPRSSGPVTCLVCLSFLACHGSL